MAATSESAARLEASGEPLDQEAGGAPALAEILLEAITALSKAGEVEKACRLAGQACMALRRTDPKAARRFDVLLHRMTPKLEW